VRLLPTWDVLGDSDRADHSEAGNTTSRGGKHHFLVRDRAFEQFAFAFQPSVDRTMLRELAGLSFVERTESVVPARAARAIDMMPTSLCM
jgi:hypothetical protein